MTSTRSGTTSARYALCGTPTTIGPAEQKFLALVHDTWQDALSVMSLIAPVLMFVIAALDFAVAIREA